MRAYNVPGFMLGTLHTLLNFLILVLWGEYYAQFHMKKELKVKKTKQAV